MKSILHISTECYPAAKAGGMGDVLGALPQYLPQHGFEASVILPKYKNAWFGSQAFKNVYSGEFKMGNEIIRFDIESLKNKEFPFPLYAVSIKGLFDRPQIYLDNDGEAFHDEIKRNIAFQTSIVNWLINDKIAFDGLHCHDHMTGLIPFFTKHTSTYSSISELPIFFTIHNGQYRGTINWSDADLLPDFDESKKGILDWDKKIHSLATAIKCAWKVNTVSPSYMKELLFDFDNLTPLVLNENQKCSGIINGIDINIWDPKSDKYLDSHLVDDNWTVFKGKHKTELLKKFNLKSRRPLISFIGRFAYEKGADLLSESIEEILENNSNASFIILGSGDKEIEAAVKNLALKYKRDVASIIAYDEKLARKIYAGSDFLIMPSRFEPCGLNQMYSMRYATVPVVRSTGGLIDTVPDIVDGGNGISFANANKDDIVHAISRAIDLYSDKKSFHNLRKQISELDYSWSNSAFKYAQLYKNFIN